MSQAPPRQNRANPCFPKTRSTARRDNRKKMLVINRVELVPRPSISPSDGEFHRYRAFGLRRTFNPPTKSLMLGHMRQDIVHEQVCTFLFWPDPERFWTPETLTTVESPFLLTAATFAAGSIPNTGTPRWAKYCEISIVTGYLHNMVTRPNGEVPLTFST